MERPRTFRQAISWGEHKRKEYFLGAAVFVNNQTYHLILDGQQRLATATILLAALRDKIREYNLDAANQIQSNFISLQDHLGGGNLPKLQLNEFDRAFFRDSVQSFPRVAAAPTKNSHKLILKAYAYLAERVRLGWDLVGACFARRCSESARPTLKVTTRARLNRAIAILLGDSY